MLILLAVYHPRPRNRCRELLERLGHTVVDVSRGKNALEQASKDEFDVLITSDYFGWKDDMTGVELLQAIREHEIKKKLRRALPVVVMSENITNLRTKWHIEMAKAALLVEAPLKEKDMGTIFLFAQDGMRIH